MSKPFKGTFVECVEFERGFRQKNQFLCAKHGWTLDPFEIEEWVEQQQVARCVAHGWTSYLDGNPVSPPNWSRQPSPSRDALADVAEAAPRTPVSLHVVMRWLGDDLIPLTTEQAERRAGVCAVCPKNMISNVADDTRTLLAVRSEMGLRTSHDHQLNVCQACHRHTKLMVFSKFNPITAIDMLDPSCWFLKELVNAIH